MASNGGLLIADDGSSCLLPCDRLEWLRICLPAVADAWGAPDGVAIADEDYLVYGVGQVIGAIRTEHVHSTLLVSEPNASDLYLLNPVIRTADGEWEAWEMMPKAAGVRRHMSFFDLLAAKALEIAEPA